MLTKKQRNLLEVVEKQIAKHGSAPSYDEACKLLNLKSKSGIHRTLKALEERGYVRRLPNRARAIEVLRHADGTYPGNGPPKGTREYVGREIPLLGYVAAGTPVIVWEDTNSSYVGVPADWVHPGSDYFGLEVRGDSMMGAGILEGDTAVIRRQDTAQNGDIVVALVNGEEVTLKRLQFQKKGKQIILKAENPDFEDIVCSSDAVFVQGLLAGVLRRYN